MNVPCFQVALFDYFHFAGEAFVRDQGLQDALRQLKGIRDTNSAMQEAAMKIISEHLNKMLKDALEGMPTEKRLSNQLAACCLTTHLLSSLYEHIMLSDPQAKSTTGRKELALRSLTPSLRPDGSATGISLYS